MQFGSIAVLLSVCLSFADAKLQAESAPKFLDLSDHLEKGNDLMPRQKAYLYSESNKQRFNKAFTDSFVGMYDVTFTSMWALGRSLRYCAGGCVFAYRSTIYSGGAN